MQSRSSFRKFLLGLVAAGAAAGLLGWTATAAAAGVSQGNLHSTIAGLPDLGGSASTGAAVRLQAKQAAPTDPQAMPGDQHATPKDLILRGDAVCTRCHDAQSSPQVMKIALTPHGTTADPRTPTCISCHGESIAHRQGQALPDRVFGQHSKTPVAVQNQACLTCHQDSSMLSHWAGSTHQLQHVACVSCHRIHAAHDPMFDKRTQPEVCFTCHKNKRMQVNLPFHHPIPEGKMACSDCHNPMGSVGPHLLKRDSVNDTCYTCHMEKRGPFVHNHDPVQENCTICHNPHGTVVADLLKMRPPMLCHRCHSPHGAQVLQLMNQAQATGSLSSFVNSAKNGITYTMARGCLNCHTEIHGSNNPISAIPLGVNPNPSPVFLFR